MAVQMPDRPQKGRKIPSDYFLSMWDHQKSLELGGDLKTTTVTRTNAGTTVSANLGTQRGGGQRTYAYIAKITADNNDGTYDADEQENDAGTFQANTDEGLEFGSATNDIGYLYELNGLPGVPVGTFVVVHKTSDISGDPIWYFDGQEDAYGVDGSGAWVEITGHSSGAYSWKQKDPDASTDTSPAVTGANNAHTVNETEGIPNGTTVWLRYDGTDYRFEYDRLRFLAKITGESSGSYSWTELEGDGATTTTRTGTYNAEEVSGRLGIPTNSVVDMIPNQIDSNEYKFEYHGALAGTLDTLNSGTSATANTDTWARDNQGGTLGEEHPFVARLTVDPTTGEMVVFDRVQEHDANGHEEAISAETKTIVGVLTPSTQTYEFVDCDTGLVTVARFDFADLPDDDYCWIHDGSDFVKCYNDGLSAGAATSPLPCILYMPTTPANCAAVTYSAFDDTMDDSSIDTCRLTTDTLVNATVVEDSTGIKITFDGKAAYSRGRVHSEAPLDDDFDVSIDMEQMTGFAGTGDYYASFFLASIGGTSYYISAGSETAAPTIGVYYWDGSTMTNYTTSIPTSGTFRAARTGSTLKMYWDGVELFSVTVATTTASVLAGYGGRSDPGETSYCYFNNLEF